MHDLNSLWADPKLRRLWLAVAHERHAAAVEAAGFHNRGTPTRKRAIADRVPGDFHPTRGHGYKSRRGKRGNRCATRR